MERFLNIIPDILNNNSFLYSHILTHDEFVLQTLDHGPKRYRFNHVTYLDPNQNVH